MEDFFKEFNGDFIYINCNIFPITSFMYRDRKILKQESVYELYNYVENLISIMNTESLNLNILKKYEDNVLELIINEKGIVKISLKEKYYDR